MELFFFYFFGGLTLAMALAVILFKNPVSSAFSLVVSFFGMAALYAMLGAHLLAVIQILVYAGAIMVLFIFVVMLLNLKPDELKEKPSGPGFKLAIGAGIAAFLFKLIAAFQNQDKPFPVVSNDFGTLKSIGVRLFTEYWFPFEYVSVLILAALIGGVAIAKKDI